MEIRGNEGNIVEPCEQENFKTNCAPDESSELEVKCTNISNAKCVGILAEKIHDCVYLESLQFADKDEVFAIDNYDPKNPSCNTQYRVGDAVCIDEISLCYDNIGIKDDDTTEGMAHTNPNALGEGNICVRYDMEDKVFSAVPGTGVAVYNYPDNAVDDENLKCNTNIPSIVNLYDEFEGTANRTRCNAEQENAVVPKSRVFKQGVRYHVDNLKIKIKGRIGNRPFTATKDYSCYGDLYGNGSRITVNPVEITKKDTLGNGEGCGTDVGLNFTPVNLYGRVSVPSDGRTVRSNIKLEHCLSADCVETTERYGDYGEGYIHATVGYSFLVNHNIRHTTSEELAVFTNPCGVECHDASRESDCNGNDTGDVATKPRRCGCRR